MKGMPPPVRALLSVHDKTNLIPFAKRLASLGFELVSTGGTATSLQNAGLLVTSVESVTGFPEMLDGRVKTLHPRIHGGLLARHDLPDHVAQLEAHGITPIDVLVSNLYPFETAVRDSAATDAEKIEQIDIGGPAMVRAAAKNFTSVIVVTDSGDYETIAAHLETGSVTPKLRRALAAKAFAHVSTYDSVVASFLQKDSDLFPTEFSIGLHRDRMLRYGENPQQQAAAYRRLEPIPTTSGLLDAEHLGGPELSFNNLLDGDAAWRASQLFQEPTVAIVKHTIPCGLATREDLDLAYEAALAGDPVSAFGGIVALNRDVDVSTAQRLTATRFDIVIAPNYSEEALAVIRKRKNTRILRLTCSRTELSADASLDVRPISGGMLVQTQDNQSDDESGWKVVTSRPPSDTELEDLRYAWAAARLVKSNAIVLANDRSIVGVGAGQPNRLESVNIAVRKAAERAKGAALASDAFFPFADGLEQAAAAGISAVIQPGGSVRDAEVIAAAEAAGIAMVMTGTRHFRH
jgi:phosphoribosylaminoimidazolecarboxamide formyltransferase/IMP cyclohydrolase